MLVAAATLTLGFVHDDRALLEDNARLGDLSTLPSALLHDLFWLADGQVRPSPYWRPFVTLSYYVDQRVGGGTAWAFHLGNAVGFVGLALAALRAYGGRAAGALAVGVALLHPLFAEPLSNITARTDLYLALFGTLALLAPKGWRLVPLALALGCKEVAVIIPALFFMQERTQGKDTRSAMRSALPAGLVVGAFVLVRQLLVGGRSAGPPWEGWAAMPARLVHALGRLIWPGAGPRPDLDLEHLTHLPTAAGLALAIVVIVLPLWLAHRSKLAVPLAITLWPTLMTAGLVSPGLRYADGFAAWPLVGVGWMLARLPRPWMWMMGPLVCIFAAGQSERIAVWTSPDTLWTAALDANPQDPRVQLKTGRVRLAEQPAEALRLSEGARSHPDARIQREGHELAARALLLLPDAPETAIRHHLTIAADMDDLEAGWACAAACVWDDTATNRWQMCETAVARDAATADVYNTMGVMRAGEQDLRGARDWFALAVEAEPERSEFRDNLAKAERLLRR